MPAATAVREQYETLPYPPRNPVRELEHLHATLPGELNLVQQVLWGARRPLHSLRILDAGCGTGDAVVFMGEQLRRSGAEVIGLDFSEASLAIAQQRLDRRQIKNVRLVHGGIEDLPSLGLGRLDYVVSAGVLHHLPDPLAGLRAIADVLKEDGGVGIMVYGLYGRTAIYQLQELFRRVAPPSMAVSERLQVVRSVLGRLGPDHWASLGRSSWEGEVKLHGDAGLFDLFLHATDRAYTVPDIYDWLGAAGMRMVRFDVPAMYDPSTNWSNLDLGGRPAPEQQAAAEILHGRMKKHTFFATRQSGPVPEPPAADDPSAIPTWLIHEPDWVLQQVATRPQLMIRYEDMDYRCALDAFRREFLKRVDGRRSAGAILDEIGPVFPRLGRAELVAKWRDLHQALALFNILGVMRPAHPQAQG
jgi:SAM-dependent methyltransferase